MCIYVCIFVAYYVHSFYKNITNDISQNMIGMCMCSFPLLNISLKMNTWSY
jgi:hypothetical protein